MKQAHLARPDGQTQDIEVDENTSFKKDNVASRCPTSNRDVVRDAAN